MLMCLILYEVINNAMHVHPCDQIFPSVDLVHPVSNGHVYTTGNAKAIITWQSYLMKIIRLNLQDCHNSIR